MVWTSLDISLHIPQTGFQTELTSSVGLLEALFIGLWAHLGALRNEAVCHRSV